MTDPAKPKITDDLIALRKHVGGLKAEKKGGVAFAVKSAKDLMIKLRAALDDLDMLMYPVATRCEDLPAKSGTLCLVHQTIRVVSSDGSFVEFAGVGHGQANDDKAAGKASTYAWKDAIIKGLCLPDDDMASVSTKMVDTDDESVPIPSRTNKAGEVQVILAALLVAKTSDEVEALSAKAKALKPSREDAIPLQRAFSEARARVG